MDGRSEKGIRSKGRKWEEIRAKEGRKEMGKAEKNMNGVSEKGIRGENGSKRRRKREREKSRKTWMEEMRKVYEARGENGRK